MICQIGTELGKHSVKRRRGGKSFPDLAESDGIEFGTAMVRANDLIGRGGERSHFGGARFRPMEFAEISGIEKEPLHRASRSSERPMALSVSDVRAPDFKSASYSGSSFRVAQYEVEGSPTRAVSSSEVSAVSIK